MKQGIVIATWSGGEEAFTTLRNSIPDDVNYPIVVVVNDGLNAEWINEWIEKGKDDYIKLTGDTFELGAIKAVLNFTDLDEFIFFQDTFEVIDASIFGILFNSYPEQSVAYNPHFQMYLGKFRREILMKMQIPEVASKIESVRQEELFTKAYRELETVAIFNPEFKDGNFYGSWEERWGRKNLVLKDDYLIKRKGTWNSNQL